MKSIISAVLGAGLVVSLFYCELVVAIAIAFALLLVFMTSFPDTFFDNDDYSNKKSAGAANTNANK